MRLDRVIAGGRDRLVLLSGEPPSSSKGAPHEACACRQAIVDVSNLRGSAIPSRPRLRPTRYQRFPSPRI
jgi:hypothetical protein